MVIYTPEDAKKNFSSSIPDFVFKAFNDLLAEKWNEHSITIKQSDVISKILRYSGRELTADETINNNWLDVEPAYVSRMVRPSMTHVNPNVV